MNLSDVFDVRRRGMMAPSSRTEFGRAIRSELPSPERRFDRTPEEAFEEAETLAEEGKLQVVFERPGGEGPFWTGDPESGVSAVALNLGQKQNRVEEAKGSVVIVHKAGTGWTIERGGALLSRAVRRVVEKEEEGSGDSEADESGGVLTTEEPEQEEEEQDEDQEDDSDEDSETDG
jgi:hypothetical protein